MNQENYENNSNNNNSLSNGSLYSGTQKANLLRQMSSTPSTSWNYEYEENDTPKSFINDEETYDAEFRDTKTDLIKKAGIFAGASAAVLLGGHFLSKYIYHIFIFIHVTYNRMFDILPK